MSDKIENPPAFAHGEGENTYPQQGMTLRDYFAAHSLAGLSLTGFPNDIATSAYEIADAMLAERVKEKQ